MEKYGAILEGTRLTHWGKGRKSMPLYYPIIYLLRRLVFAYIVVAHPTNPFLQLSSQIYFSLIAFAYLLNDRPLESQFALRMEYMNEATLLLVTYHILCFTDAVEEVALRYTFGVTFIVTLTACISVHLFFLVAGSCKNLKQACKECKEKRKAKKPNLGVNYKETEKGMEM